MPTTMNISVVKTLCIGQLVTLKAKVAHVGAQEVVGSKILNHAVLSKVSSHFKTSFLLHRKRHRTHAITAELKSIEQNWFIPFTLSM